MPRVPFLNRTNNNKMKKLSLLTFLSILALTSSFPQQTNISKMIQKVSADDLYNFVDILASEEYEGRLTGHPGYDRSADWVIEKFKEFGVKPLGENDTFLQKFPHPYTDVFEGCKLVFHDPENGETSTINNTYAFIDGNVVDSGVRDVTASSIGLSAVANLSSAGQLQAAFQSDTSMSAGQIKVSSSSMTFGDSQSISSNSILIEASSSNGARIIIAD